MPQRSKICFFLFLFFLFIYLLSSGGHLYTKDGQIMYKVCEGFIEQGKWNVEGLGSGGLAFGKNGDLYSPYGLGQSLAYMPFYKIGNCLAHYLGRPWIKQYTISLLNSFVSALACVLFFKLALLLRFLPRTAFYCTLFYGLGTMAWPYSKFCFSEPLTSFFLLYAVYSAIASSYSEKPRHLYSCGFSMGAMSLCRISAAFFMPAIALYLLLSWKNAPFITASKILKRILILFVSALPIFLVIISYNIFRFGAWHQTGYHAYIVSEKGSLWGFTTPYFVGLYGLFFSAGKSIFLYTPLALLFIPAFKAFIKRNKKEAILFIIIVIQVIVFYSSWINWDGGISWGPRFIYPIIAFLILPIGTLLEKSKKWRLSCWILFVLGAAVNGSAVIVDFTEYIGHVLDQFPDRYSLILFHPGFSPVVGHLRLAWSKCSMLLMPGAAGYNISPDFDLGIFKYSSIGSYISSALLFFIVIFGILIKKYLRQD